MFSLRQFVIFLCFFQLFPLLISATKGAVANADNGKVKLLDEKEPNPGMFKQIFMPNKVKKERENYKHKMATNENTNKIKELEEGEKELKNDVQNIDHIVNKNALALYNRNYIVKSQLERLKQKQENDHQKSDNKIEGAIAKTRDHKKELDAKLHETKKNITDLQTQQNNYKIKMEKENLKLQQKIDGNKNEQMQKNVDHEIRMNTMASEMKINENEMKMKFEKNDDEMKKHGQNHEALNGRVEEIGQKLDGARKELEALEGNHETFQRKANEDIRRNSAEIKARGKELDDKISTNRKGIEEGVEKQNALESNIGELRGHVNRGFEEQTNLVNAQRKEGEERLKAKGGELEGKIAGIQKNQEMHSQQYQTDQEENAKRHGKHEAERGELKERTERNEAGILATNDELGKVKVGIEEQNGENRRSFDGLTAQIGEQSQGLAGTRADLLGLEGRFNGHVEKDFNGLKTKVAVHSNRLDTVNEAVEKHRENFQEMEGKIGEVNGEIKQINEKHRNLTQTVENWQSKHSELATKYDRTDSEFMKKQTEFTNYQREMAEKGTEFGKKLEKLEKEIENKETKLVNVNKELVNQKNEMNEFLNGQMRELEEKVEEINQKMVEEKQINETKFDGLNGEVSKLPDLAQKLANVEEEVKKLDNFDEKLGEQEAEMHKLGEEIEDLTKKVEENKKAIDEEMNRIGDKVENHHENVDAIKKSLKKLGDDLEGTKLNAHNRGE